MTESPPSPRSPAETDAGPLRLLARLQVAAAVLSAGGIGFLWWNYARMHAAFLDVARMKKQQDAGASLQEFFSAFAQFYLAAATVLGLCAVSNLASALFITRRRHWFLSVAVACLDCLVVPVGTLLGAFALVVLLRDSVRQEYLRKGAPGPAPGAPPEVPPEIGVRDER